MEAPILQLKDVAVYQNNNLILSNINLAIGKGELVYLIGKTGSGKSSLIKLLYGDLPLTQGQGKVVGFNLKKLNEDKIPLLRRKLGVVFQDFKLLTDRSVYDNLAFVLKATGWTDKIATGNLDPETSVEIMQVLKEINASGRTILMATHDYALILKFPSKTLKCDGERVFEVVQRRV